MSESTRLIKRYYHSIKSVNLRSLVDQVDSISVLLGDLFDADFIAVYFKKQGNDNLIPVGYHNNGNLPSPDIQKIEKEYCTEKDRTAHIVPGLLCLSEAQENSKDLFADENNLNYLYQFPFYKNNDIAVLVLAYWHEYPDYDEKKIKKVIPTVYNLLQNTLNSIDEHKKANDYTIRLSDLIALFEIDISEFRYVELVDKLVHSLKNIIPGGYLIFSTDRTNNCEFTNHVNIDKPHEQFVKKLEIELGSFSKELDEISIQNGIWVEFAGQIETNYNTILVSPICKDSKRKTFLVYVSDQINPLKDNDKQLLSLFSLLSSLILKASLLLETEKKVNKLLKKTSSQMADIETLAALTDLTSGVAHEFNNMIGGIVGRVQLLKLKVEEDDVLQKLDKIEMIAQDGAETVRRIQEFSSGAKYTKTKQFDLASLLRAFADNQEYKWYSDAQVKNVNVITNVEIPTAFITGIYDDILLALNNIVENGVEHAKENSTVLIEITENTNCFVISVHNEGSEINQTELKRIFYPFFTKKETYGAGMGLSIVHGIVTRHGGKISVTSSDADGTTFKIELLKLDAVEDVSDVSRRIKTVRQLKILVVDDDDQIREVLTDMLSIDGYDTVACEDGYKALEAFNVEEFDLVITDLGMPGMSGLELAGEIHAKNPELPIAMITGWGTQLNHDEVALNGIKTVLSKPFHLKDIKAMISELV